MDLPCTASRGTKGVVAMLNGDVIKHLIQRGWELASRHLQAKHELKLLLGTWGAEIAVVLLIRPMKFHDLNGTLRDEDLIISKLLWNRIAQLLGDGLESLYLGELFRGFGTGLGGDGLRNMKGRDMHVR